MVSIFLGTVYFHFWERFWEIILGKFHIRETAEPVDFTGFSTHEGFPKNTDFKILYVMGQTL